MPFEQEQGKVIDSIFERIKVVEQSIDALWVSIYGKKPPIYIPRLPVHERLDQFITEMNKHTFIVNDNGKHE